VHHHREQAHHSCRLLTHLILHFHLQPDPLIYIYSERSASSQTFPHFIQTPPPETLWSKHPNPKHGVVPRLLPILRQADHGRRILLTSLSPCRPRESGLLGAGLTLEPTIKSTEQLESKASEQQQSLPPRPRSQLRRVQIEQRIAIITHSTVSHHAHLSIDVPYVQQRIVLDYQKFASKTAEQLFVTVVALFRFQRIQRIRHTAPLRHGPYSTAGLLKFVRSGARLEASSDVGLNFCDDKAPRVTPSASYSASVSDHQSARSSVTQSRSFTEGDINTLDIVFAVGSASSSPPLHRLDALLGTEF